MNTKVNPYGAKNMSEVLKEGLQYIDDRRTGRVKSFKTPWTGLNYAGIGGLEWGSMMTIGARPGMGKTMIVSQILRESRIYNPDQDFSILEFQFEMGDKQYAARQFAAEVAMDYNVVLSSYKALDDFAYQHMQKHLADTIALEKAGINRKLIGKPLSVVDIEKATRFYYEAMGAKPMVVTIDHSWLIKKGAGEKDKFDVLYNTAEMLMQLKNDLPIIVLMITQMNRTMEEASRTHPGQVANYPTSGDIFGGDALMQSSDMVVAVNRPHKANINIYGPKKWVTHKDQIFLHILKARNGNNDDNILFFDAEFNRGRMTETVEPQTAQVNSGYVPFNSGRPNGGGGGNNPRRPISADIGDEL
jgi:replicative DNA helicase